MNSALLIKRGNSEVSIIYKAKPKKIKAISCRLIMGISVKKRGKDRKKNADKKAKMGIVYFLVIKKTRTGEVANNI